MINLKKQRTDLKAVPHDLGTRSDDQQPECRSQKYPILRIEIARIVGHSRVKPGLGSNDALYRVGIQPGRPSGKEELAMIWMAA